MSLSAWTIISPRSSLTDDLSPLYPARSILDKTDKFIDVAAYAGTVVLTGSCVMVLARWFLLRRLWGKM